MYLDRTRGRRWSNLILYFELTFPVLFAFAGFIALMFAPPIPNEVAFVYVVIGYFAVLAAVAWVGNLLRWRWWIRWPLYIVLTFAMFVVAVGVAVVSRGS